MTLVCMNEDVLRQFDLFLDLKQENKLFVKFSYLDDFSGLKEFVISYQTLIGESFVEVIRYDSSLKENLHVHELFHLKSKKVFLGGAPDMDLLIRLKDQLEKNWRKYLLKYKER